MIVLASVVRIPSDTREPAVEGDEQVETSTTDQRDRRDDARLTGRVIL
jgi:hypothetical protein